MIIEILLLVVFLLFLYVLLEYIGHLLTLKNYPPGPFPLPVIGNLHIVGLKPYETLRDLGKKYGDVFSISFGMHRLVVINKIDPAREALITKGSAFLGRPNDSYTFSIVSRGYKGISFADYGPCWVLNRKLGHAALKMYGDAMGNLESKVVLNSEDLHLRLNESEGKPVDVQVEYGLCTINIMSSIIFGTRYKRNDPEFLDVINSSNLVTTGLSSSDPATFLPWLRFFPSDGITKIREAVKIRDPLLLRKLKQHRDTYDPDNIRDFTDSLIKSSMNKSLWEHAGVKNDTDDHLLMILADIFGGGAGTTATALRWITVYLLHWPHFQDEVYNEIKEEVGLDRYPDLKDRPKLPLTQAVIQETLRLSSFLPLIGRKATVDSSIGGKSVPKGTQVLFNTWHYHHDPAEWEYPEVFNPHRWLDEEGKYDSRKHKSFLPFSAGRRVCLGESVTKTELFLVISRLIKDFKIEANRNEPFPKLEGMIGITLSPHYFSTIFVPREHVN